MKALNHVHMVIALLLLAFLSGYFIAGPDAKNLDNLVTGLCQGGMFVAVSGLFIAAAEGFGHDTLGDIKQEGNLGLFGGFWILALAISMAL